VTATDDMKNLRRAKRTGSCFRFLFAYE